jgi:hypothetical protein
MLRVLGSDFYPMTTSDKINMGVEFFTALSAIGVLASVVVAIYLYKRTHEHTFLSEFRQTLLELCYNHYCLMNVLSAPYLAESAHRVALRLTELLPQDVSADDLAVFLQDPAHHNYICQAIHLGRLDSQLVLLSQPYLLFLRTAPFRFRDRFPIILRVSRSLIHYVISVTELAQSHGLYESTVGDSRSIASTLCPQLAECPSLRLARVQLELFLGNVAATVLKEQQRILEESRHLFGIIADAFVKMSDRQLRQQSRKQTDCEMEACDIDCECPVDDAFAYLQLIRCAFSATTWDLIVQKVTTLRQAAHSESNVSEARTETQVQRGIQAMAAP